MKFAGYSLRQDGFEGLRAADDEACCVAVVPDALRIAATSPEPEIVRASDAELLSRANQLIKSGKAGEALAVIERESGRPLSAELAGLRKRLTRVLQLLRDAAPERLASGESTTIIALGCILGIIARTRVSPPPARRLGPIALVTGHLGAGGAELQMSRTAELLHGAAKADQHIGGVKIGGPVHVVVKSLAPEANRSLDFFLPRLTGRGIPVHQLDELAAVKPDDLSLDSSEIADLLHLMPSGIRRGLRMVPWLRKQKIGIAYLWQDGSILDFAIASLLAKVPRLVVNFRGMPPRLRSSERLDEYKELYCALATMPGVSFVSNSGVAADAYSAWLSCPRELFHIVRNGVALHAPHPLRSEIELWSNFEQATENASITVGGIFRMHPNKRPLEWIRFALKYQDTHPNARFILIGSGILFDEVKELATKLGLMRRLLLLPQTRAGAYWLKKMDVFVLLSRFEGTPNVLIEAQLAGVPVISTPIANARDTFVEGITGLATASAKFLDIDDVISKVDRILTYAKTGNAVNDHARRHIASRYSMGTMIDHTVKVLSGRDQKCCTRLVASA